MMRLSTINGHECLCSLKAHSLMTWAQRKTALIYDSDHEAIRDPTHGYYMVANMMYHITIITSAHIQ